MDHWFYSQVPRCYVPMSVYRCIGPALNSNKINLSSFVTRQRSNATNGRSAIHIRSREILRVFYLILYSDLYAVQIMRPRPLRACSGLLNVINGIAVENENAKWKWKTLTVLIYVAFPPRLPIFSHFLATMPIIAQINRLLAHQPLTMLEDDKNPSLLLWNVREAPSTFLLLNDSPSRNLYPHELASPATQPPVTHLRIFCGIFLDSDLWRIEVRNPRGGGVTVRDVCMAIYEAFQQPMSFPNQYFSALSAKTQTRILDVYHTRVRSTGPDALVTWEAGIQRGDCLMRHTWFGGLSLPFVNADGKGKDMENTCILSLRIGDDAVASPTGIVPSPFR